MMADSSSVVLFGVRRTRRTRRRQRWREKQTLNSRAIQILLAPRKSLTTQPSLHIGFRFHGRLLSLKRRAIGRPKLGEITVGSGRNASPCQHRQKRERKIWRRATHLTATYIRKDR